jgi:diguanylate cyclase (GGDEF)-like protein
VSWQWRRGRLRDRLTDLANRRLLESRLAHAQLRARRHGFTVAVLSIDVDELASVNNTMGREYGDRLLREVADRLRRLSRDEDTVARTGSDEFAVLLEQVDSPTGAARFARRVLVAFTQPVVVAGRSVSTSLSIGIAVDAGGVRSAETLFSEAGIALARAKARGKRRFETFEPPMGDEAAARLTLEADLQRAIARSEFVLHYQPIVDLQSGAVTSVEALVRWDHPVRGLLLPAHFIPAAETSGSIVAIGREVLRTACTDATRFNPLRTARTVGVNVNVSARQFRDSGQLLADVREALIEGRLPAELLTLEITESSLLEDLDGAIDVVRRLRDMGVGVTLDDFGTGYSSLAHLKRLPVTGLKIDRSFVQDLADPATAAIMRALVGLADELGISVTAEGAENADAVARLRALGCRLAQGHYFCDAIPVAALGRLVNQLPDSATA